MIRYLLCLILVTGTVVVSAKKKKKKEVQKEETVQLKETVLTEEQEQQLQYHLIEAQSAMSQGDIQQAVTLLSSCTQIDPSCAVAYYELANIAISVSNTEAALNYARKAVSINPKNKWYQKQLALIYEGRGMLEQSASVYQELVRRDPSDKESYLKQIMLYETLEKWESSIAVYEQYEQQFGRSEVTVLGKQNLYLKQGDRKRAYAELKNLIKETPNEVNYYGMLADLYNEDGKTKEALKLYDKIKELAPENGTVQFFLASHYNMEGDFERSYLALQKAIASSDVTEETKINAIFGLMQTDTTSQLNQRIQTLTKEFVKQYPDNITGRLILGQSYRDEDKNELAKEQLELALQIDSLNRNGLIQLVMVNSQLDEFEAMYENALRGTRIFPEDSWFYLFVGVAGNELKRYEKAEVALKKGMSLASQDNAELLIQYQFTLADNFYKRKEAAKAFEIFEDIMSKDPENVVVLNNYSYYLSLENQQLDKAEEMSRACIEKEPESSTYLDTYAWVLYKKGEYEKAKTYIEKAFANSEETELSGEVWEHYGDILFKLGEKEEAKEKWKKAKELGVEEAEALDLKIKTGAQNE